MAENVAPRVALGTKTGRSTWYAHLYLGILRRVPMMKLKAASGTRLTLKRFWVSSSMPAKEQKGRGE